MSVDMSWLVPFGVVMIFAAVVVGLLMKMSLTFPKSCPATHADIERSRRDVEE